MNYLLKLSYDGTNYCGFQVQPNGRSVAAVFQDALEAVLGCRPDIKGCSRTDAGVHALGFMLNFHADTRIPAAKLPLALNQHLPPDIRALEARVVPDDFHARYAAHTKTYLYRIHNSPIDSPFAARYYTKVPGRLDADKMQQAAQYFVGKHDFLALCASGSSAAAHGDTVRTITACDVQRRGDDIDITVTADGYLYNMVRILAGTLCEAGAGRLAPEAVPGILAGVILAIGRIVGETAALIYTSGTVAGVPETLMGSGRTLAVHMYALLSNGLYTEQAYATAVVLLVMVVGINALSAWLAKKVSAKQR